MGPLPVRFPWHALSMVTNVIINIQPTKRFADFCFLRCLKRLFSGGVPWVFAAGGRGGVS